MPSFIKRYIHELIADDLKDIDAVFINGPRQVGKSTLVEAFGEQYKQVTYITFDDITMRAAEIASPGATFNGVKEGLVILDEIQHVPASFLALKLKIDEARRKKEKLKFLLTGSADIMLFPQLSQALVGRVYVRTLYPFSAGEIFEIKGNFIEKMFTSTKGIPANFSEFNFPSVISKATFPKLSLDVKNKTQWCQSYISTLLERDIKNLADIDKIELLPQLLSIMAGRIGGLLNEADLAGVVKASQPTLKRYRALLDGVFLTCLLPPWFKNLEKRLVKSPKIYFNDTMLLCHILGVFPGEVKKKRPDIYGFLVENFVLSELKKQLSLMNDGKIFHFRTSDQKEIDFIIEKRNGSLLAIEVKASETVRPDDFKHIRFLQNNLKEKFSKGIVLYSGKRTVEFGENLLAIPIPALWQI
ncbi:MAG: ATP-binding protein [Treponema sp.]|nr:ATP-binding protein [Treponema sp.]